MNTKSQGEMEEARGETVEVLLAQLKDTLDKQFHAVDGLDQKAGMVLGSGSLVVALIAVLASGLLQGLMRANTVSPYLQLGFVIGAVLYIGITYTAWCGRFASPPTTCPCNSTHRRSGRAISA